MSDKEVFVNRRGRKATIDEDIAAIEVADNTQPEPVVNEIKKERKRSEFRRPEFHKPQISSRRTLVLVLVGLAILFVPIISAELLALQYRQNADKIQSETVRIGTEVALKKQNEKKYREALDISRKELSSLQQSSCKGGLLDNAASLYPRAKSALAECNEANQQLSALVGALTTLQQVDDYTIKAQSIIKTPLAPSSEAYAVIPDQIAAWQTASEKLKGIKAPAAVSSFHSAFSQAVQGMADGWSELNVANNVQDQTGFDAAEKKLTESYATLRNLSSELNTQLTQFQTQITSKYKDIAS